MTEKSSHRRLLSIIGLAGILFLPSLSRALDTTRPIISYVTASGITSSSAAITWKTNEYSTSKLYYGLSSSVTSSLATNLVRVLNHKMTLTGLQANKLYYYRVRSVDAAGNISYSNLHS